MNKKSNHNQAVKNLGDYMGIDPAPQISSSDSSETNRKIEEKDDSRIIDSFPEQEEEQAEYESPIIGNEEMTGEMPAMWMLHPQKFPSVLESFRTMKNKIAALKEKDGLNVFLVSGADEGVGTSTVAFNLGLTLSFDFADQRILIIDANLYNPSLHNAFNFLNEPGLMDFLMGNAGLESVVRSSPYSNLDLITSGKTDSNIKSPFDLETFKDFVKKMSNRYDFVLFDSSPVLKSSQTRIISSKIHGVIIVAEANRIRWEVMSEIKRQLSIDGAKLVGSFLNRRKFVIPRWAYRFV